uniref:Uncharacterized protein n=1 Tax=Tetraselmis chuii TaxID=63592 RepID=A0A7S1X151_9CHLO|mmetsp:Transcript_18100/g.32244  ORF Transcript_18100/g.32244 Transcript_18100/m.32244 type:complete len:335 (+) Transcript_18100:3-1007(+)
MFLMDSWMVYDLSAKFLGQLVAGAMIAIGGVGSLGASKRSRALLNLHIVGVIIAVMLGVQYITAFSRDNYVNCAMARLFVRTQKLEKHLEKQPAVTMFTHVVSRLNEMEDMLHALEDESVDKLKAKLDVEKMLASDGNYIKYKLQMLKTQADKMLHHVGDHSSAELEALSEKERAVLQNRIDTAETVIDRVMEHLEEGEEIGFEEYEDLLAALTDAYDGLHEDRHKSLTDHKKQLSFDKEIFERQAQSNPVDGDAEKRRREERQRAWRKRLRAAMVEHSFSTSNANLNDLPQWCMQDRSYTTALFALGLSLIAMQLGSGFCVLSLSFNLPAKAE